MNLFATFIQPKPFQDLPNVAFTTLALPTLLPNFSLADQRLLRNLARAKRVLESYAHQLLYFLSQIEDPILIDLTGAWDPFEQHWRDFIPSPADQNLLNLRKDQGAVGYLFHIDIPQSSLSLHTPAISIVRQSVNPGQRAIYNMMNHSAKRLLGVATQQKATSHGINHVWRIGKEEVVRFAGWTSV